MGLFMKFYQRIVLLFLLFLVAAPVHFLFAQSAEQAKISFIKRTIEAYFVKNLAVEKQDLFFEYPDESSFHTAVKLDFDRVEMLPSRNRVRLGIQMVKCLLRFKNRPVRTIPIKIRVKRFQDVVVSTRQLDRHCILQTGDVALARRETTQLRKRAFFSPGKVIGLRVNRIIQAGEIITQNLVETQPIITLGTKVEIVVQKGALQITMPGVARADGRLGDIIKVKSLETRKILSAKIINAQTVYVNL